MLGPRRRLSPTSGHLARLPQDALQLGALSARQPSRASAGCFLRGVARFPCGLPADSGQFGALGVRQRRRASDAPSGRSARGVFHSSSKLCALRASEPSGTGGACCADRDVPWRSGAQGTPGAAVTDVGGDGFRTGLPGCGRPPLPVSAIAVGATAVTPAHLCLRGCRFPARRTGRFARRATGANPDRRQRQRQCPDRPPRIAAARPSSLPSSHVVTLTEVDKGDRIAWVRVLPPLRRGKRRGCPLLRVLRSDASALRSSARASAVVARAAPRSCRDQSQGSFADGRDGGGRHARARRISGASRAE